MNCFSYRIFTTTAGVCLFFTTWGQGVTIGGNTPPASSATLEVAGNSGGFLMPRLTSNERNALNGPVIGLQIYNTDNHCVEVYFPSGWKAVMCDCNTAPSSPVSFIGPAHVCENEQGVLLSIPAVPGATAYQWTIDNQDVLVSGQGNDSIVVNFGSNPGNRTISVIASNYCGNSAAFVFSIDVSNPDPTYALVPNSPLVNSPAVFTANEPNATYLWTFQSGSPSGSVVQAPSVTWVNTGTYQVGLSVTDADGCVSQSATVVTVTNCQPAVYSFSNCGQTGYTGPSQGQCDATYGPGVVNVINGIQQWTVPQSGTYRIEAAGAAGGQGADGNPTPGYGVVVRGEVQLTAGQQIHIISGQRGLAYGGGGGGGGSFVWINGQSVPLFVAGGGGGTGDMIYGVNAVTTNDGTSTPQNAPAPATGGNGGNVDNASCGAGAGWYSNGQGTWGGFSPANGGNGGNNGLVSGGFGGGGGEYYINATDAEGGGGGGGYSGGASAKAGDTGGGGGGSFVVNTAANVATTNGLYNNSGLFNGTPILNLGNYNTGHGYVTITRVCP